MRDAEGELEVMLGFLEELTAQLLQYNRSPVPSQRLEQLRALCWDLERPFTLCRAATAQFGLAAAEDWLVCFQNYASAEDHACEAVKAIGWLWARGVSDEYAQAITEVLRALQEAAAELLRSTIALAELGESMANDASSEVARARPDLAERFAAMRADCARAAVGLRMGCAGSGAGGAGEDG